MTIVSFVWANAGERAFEERFGLSLVGRRYRRLGFTGGSIELVFLSGLENLSRAYRDELESLAFVVRDAGSAFVRAELAVPGLADLSLTHRRWFLRWLVARELYGDEPIVHLDADVVLNEDPAIVERLAAGLTFILQGCPAFAAVSDAGWYDEYESALRVFAADRDAYSERAWAEREGAEESERARWAGRLSGQIEHDQDLLSHLVHTRRLRQQPVPDVLAAFDGYLLFENPLHLDTALDMRPFTYVREGGVDYLEHGHRRGRPLLWHFQTSAARYLAKSLALARYAGGLPFGRVRLDLTTERLDRLARRVPIPTRRELYRLVFEGGDLGPAFVGRRWWRQGVFT
jgi:hypothetical protein